MSVKHAARWQITACTYNVASNGLRLMSGRGPVNLLSCTAKYVRFVMPENDLSEPESMFPITALLCTPMHGSASSTRERERERERLRFDTYMVVKRLWPHD